MLIDIKHRLHGKSIFQAEAPSLKQALTDAVEKALAARKYSPDSEFLGSSYQTVDLSGADLPRADLRGVDLAFSSFSLADLRGADLRDTRLYLTNFWGADLRGADLRGADLDFASLSFYYFPYQQAFLSGARLEGCKPGSNLDSRLLLSEILRQAAGDDLEKQQAADQIPTRSWTSMNENKVDWDQWAKSTHPLKDWMLDTVARYVDEDDRFTPNLLKNRFPAPGRQEV